jgi:hypothetical protein
LFKKDFGAILGVTYNRTHRNLEFGNRYYSFDNTNASLLFDYSSHKYSSDVLAGALANFSLKLNADNKISLRNILNINSSDYTTLRNGLDYEQNSSLGENLTGTGASISWTLTFRSKSAYNITSQGKMQMLLICC